MCIEFKLSDNAVWVWDAADCEFCYECCYACSTGGLHFDGRFPVLDADSCSICESCCDVCETGSLYMEWKEVINYGLGVE